MPAPGPERFNLARHCLGRQAAERGGKTALVARVLETWWHF